MIRFKLLLLIILAFVFVPLFLPAAGSGETQDFDTIPQVSPVVSDGGKISIVATTSFVGDVLSDIAGDSAEITILMPSGQNPHSWEPGPGDIAAIEDADLIFINGFNLEEELLRILEGMNTGPVIPVSAGVTPIVHDEDAEEDDESGEHADNHDEEHHHEDGDPHVWLSPASVVIWAENIGRTLSLADPGNQDGYRAAAQSYIDMLESLDREIRNMVSALAPEKRKLVTDHVSFDYYAREYGFEIAGSLVSSVNDQAEPSAREIAALSELIRHEDVRAIFVGGTSGRGLRVLAESVAAESGEGLSIVELLSGSLAPAGERGDSYQDFIRFNTELIVDALAEG